MILITEEKKKMAEEIIALVNKKFGDGVVVRLGDKPKKRYETISTGAIGLDYIVGNGGIPKGRVIEITGVESSGKSTLALHIIAEIQNQGGLAGFVDVEHALDVDYASKLGVDIENLFLASPDCGEEALDIVEAMIRGGFDLVVVDSVAALVPRVELEGTMGDQQMGLQGRLMSKALRKLTGLISKSNSICIFINQLRSNIGYGAPTVSSGGKALKYYSSIRLELKIKEKMKIGEEFIGNRVEITTVKNKCYPPYKKTEVEILFGQGYNKIGEIVDYATMMGIVNKSGSWYSYKGEKLGQGRNNIVELLKNNKEMAEEIISQVKEGINT